ncbi:MAG: MFS transporter [Acetobacteraceae bacterium]|nr:MFS transporter [Acetobacteraceae bacterium]
MTPSESRAAFFRAFPAVASALVLGSIDQTITATALPAISAAFGEVERIAWVVVGYLLAGTIAAAVFGRLGDALGRKRMLLVAFGIQAAGSVAAALAPGFEALLLARLAQGFGGGGLLTLAMAVVGESVTARERGRYQAWLVACFMGASAFGPLAGGWLTALFGWRSVFLAGLPLAATGAWLTLRLPHRPPAATRFRFDALGALLFTAFVLALLGLLDRIQRMSWEALPWAAGFGAFALLACAALLRVERRVPDPLLPVPVLSEASVWRANALSACVAGAIVSLISFLPFYLIAVRGVPVATAGLMLLPMSLGGGLGALVSGSFTARTGRTMLLPVIGLVFATAMLCVLAGFAGRMPLWLLPWMLGLVTLGFGTTFPSVQTTVQVAAGAGMLGVATASVQFMRNLGSSTGAALLGAVLFGTLALMDAGLAQRFAEIMRGGRDALATLPPGELARLAEGFRALFIGAAVLAGVATVLACRVPLRRV